MTYRVLVTGSQTWDNPDLIGFVLGSLLRAHPDMVVVHGHAPITKDGTGADAMARAWCVIHSVPEERHPAEWRPGGKFDVLAGFKRNEKMVDSRPDRVEAFPMQCHRPKCQWRAPHPTHGTSHTMTLASVAGIPVENHGFRKEAVQ